MINEMTKILNKNYSFSDVANFLEHDIGVSRSDIKLIIDYFYFKLFNVPLNILEFDNWLTRKFPDYADCVSMHELLNKHFTENQVKAISILLGVEK